MIFSEQTIQTIKDKANILDIVSGHVKLVRRGVNYFGLCPFHVEKTPSFSVNVQKQTFTCFGCNSSGDAIEFIKRINNYSFQEAIQHLASIVGVYIEENNYVENFSYIKKINQFLLHHYQKCLTSDHGSLARNYLKKRNIDESMWDTFFLGYCHDEKCHLYDELLGTGFNSDELRLSGIFNDKRVPMLLGRIVFPIIDERDVCVGFGGRALQNDVRAKYINSPETGIFKKRKILYNSNLAFKEKTPIIITEGYFDVISMYKIGIKSVVAPLGTAMSEDQILLCWRHCKEPIAAFDGDSAGQNASYHLIEKTLPLLSSSGNSFKFLKLSGNADLDELANDKSANIKEFLLSSSPMKDLLIGKYLGIEQDTPEKKAYLLKTIREDMKKIPDAQVRSFYFDCIKDAVFTSNKSAHWGNNADKKDKIPKITMTNEKSIKFLFAVVLKAPAVLDFVYEQFANINLYNELKDTIISLYTSAQNNIEKNLIESLKKMGYNDALDLVLTRDVLLHTTFVGEAAIADVAEEWLRVYNKHYASKNERTEISDSLKKKFSEKEWELLKYLKGGGKCL